MTEARVTALERARALLARELIDVRWIVQEEGVKSAADATRVARAWEGVLDLLTREQHRAERILSLPKPAFKKGQRVRVSGYESLGRLQRRAEAARDTMGQESSTPVSAITWRVTGRKQVNLAHYYLLRVEPENADHPATRYTEDRWASVLDAVPEADLTPVE